MNDRQRQGQRQATSASTSDPQLAATFSDGERRALVALRASYQQDHDLLSAREQERLRFVRWLVETGRLVP